MAAVASISKRISIGQSETLYVGTIALDSTMPTGGEVIDASGNERFEFLIARGGGTAATGSGYVWEFDAANQKLLAFQTKDPGAAGGADIKLQQVPNDTDLSAVTALPFIAIGQ